MSQLCGLVSDCVKLSIEPFCLNGFCVFLSCTKSQGSNPSERIGFQNAHFQGSKIFQSLSQNILHIFPLYLDLHRTKLHLVNIIKNTQWAYSSAKTLLIETFRFQVSDYAVIKIIIINNQRHTSEINKHR